MNNLYYIIPMNPPISTAEPAGEEIIAMLEENLERTFGCDPYDQMGGYVKHGLGLSTPCGCSPVPAGRGKPLASRFHGARQGMSNAPESVPFMQWVIQTLAQQVHVSAKPTNAGYSLPGTQQSHKGTMLLIDVR